MNVTVKVIGPLMYAAGFSEGAVALPAGASAADLLAAVHIAKSRPTIVTRNGKAVTPSDVLDHAGIPHARPTIVTRNGEAVAAGDAVAEGDRIVVSPIYSGG